MVSRKTKLKRKYREEHKNQKTLLHSIYKEIERESLHTHTKRKENHDEV